MIKIIFCGAGRDGTNSIAHMLLDFFRSNKLPYKLQHEYANQSFYDLFVRYTYDQDEVHINKIKDIIRECPHDFVVGNGYALFFEQFLEIYPDIKLVHIQRQNVKAAINSLAENALLFPYGHKNYVDHSEAETDRMAAFHFNEMTR